MNFSIRYKFTIIFLVLILIPLMVLGILFSSLYRKKIEDRAISEQSRTIASLQKNVIERHITDMEILISAISKTPSLHTIDGNKQKWKEIQTQWDLCREIFPDRSWIYYGSKKGNIYTSPSWEAPLEYDLTKRPWFLAGVNSTTVKWTEPYIEYVHKDIVISATIGIRNEVNEFTGVLSIDTTAKDFLELLSSEVDKEESEILVISEDGFPISLNDVEDINYNYNWLDFIRNANNQNKIQIGNSSYLVNWVYISKLKLYLVSLVPYKNVLLEIRSVQIIIFIIISFGILSALLAAFYMAKTFIRNIEAVNKSVIKIAKGNYDHTLIINSKDEFETLNNGINNLSDQIYSKISELKKLNTELDKNISKKDELLELRTSLIHLMSHNSASSITYLYNTSFDLLQKNSKNSDFKLIYNASKDLKTLNENIMTLLKLDEGINESLCEELDLAELTNLILNNYEIHSKEKNIKINLDYKAFKSINNNYFIIRMILENLISNALKYSSFNSEIIISIFMNNSHVVWEIADRGPGFTEEDLTKIYKKFNTLSAQPTGGESSIGLGLYICKELAHKVNIKVIGPIKNDPIGSIFRVMF